MHEPDASVLALLDWYDRQKRDLPWRRHPDPYFIWVSEIMLQQTQVATALPYFEAFVEAFPTYRDLAAAPIDDVLSRWSGLGYYRRARMLHQAARHLVEQNKELPSTFEGLLELPGIGPYTAAAIASIAFGRHVAVLDGNVERVISRKIAFGEDPKTAAAKRFLTAETLRLVSPERPGDSNQALMELGATVCRPKAPKCLICPLRDDCLGRSSPESYPVPRKRRRAVKVDISVVVAERDGKVLLFRRPADASLLAGMWELPHVVQVAPPAETDTADFESSLGRDYGGRWRVEPSLLQIKHSITHRAITFHVHPGEREALEDEVRQGSAESAWVSAEDRNDFAMSSAVAKILHAWDGNRS